MVRSREESGGGKDVWDRRGGTEFARGERDGVLQKYVARPADRSCVYTVLSRFVCRREASCHVAPRRIALRSGEEKKR